MAFADRYTFGDRDAVALRLTSCQSPRMVRESRHEFLEVLHPTGFRDVRAIHDKIVKTTSEHLRIVDAALAARVDARLDDRRERYLASVARGGRVPEKAHGRYLLSGGMLLCPSCGGHFEARKYPWKPSKKTAALLPPDRRDGHPAEVYICSTRRRKPGICTNTLALPIAETDDTVLSIVEGEVLGTRYIEELLTFVDSTPDQTTWLTSERARLQTEVDRLAQSIASGVPPESIAPLMRENQTAIAKLDVQLRVPRLPTLPVARLRAALSQRSKQWKRELRKEPRVARLMLRRLVGPLTLHDVRPSFIPQVKVAKRLQPDYVYWEATPTTELLEGLAARTLVEKSGPGIEPGSRP